VTPTYAEHLAALRTEGAALADAARQHLTAPVPTCPGWDVRRLVAHTGRVHRYAAGIVAERRTGPPEGRPAKPAPDEDVLTWYAAGLATLIDALEAIDPAEPVWNWSARPQTAAFWGRRMAQETVVHRWDAQSAAGTPAPISPWLAGDGVSEVFEIFLPRLQAASPVDGLTGRLHLHATDLHATDLHTTHLHATHLHATALDDQADPTGEWLVRLRPDSVHLTHEHGKGDVAVRGPAADLLLLLWNRRDAHGLDVYGDASLLELWARAVRF